MNNLLYLLSIRYRDLSEDEKKTHINSVLSGLRYFLQKISSPAKKSKMEKSQGISAFSQKTGFS